MIFKFVPMRLGVDEAGTAMLTTVLGYTSAVGVTLAIVRKVRVLFWTRIGVLLLARRGLGTAGHGDVTTATDDAGCRIAAECCSNQSQTSRRPAIALPIVTSSAYRGRCRPGRPSRCA